MSQPQVKIDSIEVNIHAPEQLHIVQPHSAQKIHRSAKDIQEEQQKYIPAVIKEQQNAVQQQNIQKNSHKIEHIQYFKDSGEFIDENHNNRVTENEKFRQNIKKLNNLETQALLQQNQLENIVEQNENEEGNAKKLKHIEINKLQDQDQFNLKNSRSNIQDPFEKRKRYLSESNVETYYDEEHYKPLLNELKTNNRCVPERIIEQEVSSPVRRERRKSSHQLHKHGSNQRIDEDFQRMIVDEVDKKKKSIKNIQKQQDEDDIQVMEAIKEEKLQDEAVNILKLEETIEKIEDQIENLSKVTGDEIGPENAELMHLTFEKKQTIDEDLQQQKEE